MPFVLFCSVPRNTCNFIYTRNHDMLVGSMKQLRINSAHHGIIVRPLNNMGSNFSYLFTYYILNFLNGGDAPASASIDGYDRFIYLFIKGPIRDHT
jgi:hypothetical protein